MTLRRLLLVGGGSAFTPAAGPTTSALTTSGHGGWTQKPKARALWHASYSYVGFVADDGDIEVVAVPDSTGVGGTPIVLKSALQVDTHAAPAMLVRDSDHKLVVVYSAHLGTSMFQRISTNSLDSDPTISGGFAAETTAFTGTSITYPMIFQRTAEASDPLYCFYRERGTGTSVLTYRKSTDGGATYGSAVSVYASSRKSTYWDIALAPNGYDLHFVVTDTVGVADQLGDILHFYADNAAYKRSDGTTITGSQPWGPADLTLVYDEASDRKAWSHDLYVDADGHPRFLYGRTDNWTPAGGTDTEYRYARWTGSAWSTSTILASGGAGQFDPLYGALDPEDQARAYLIRKISGRFELWRYTTTDNGVTWDAGEAITSGSANDNIYPVAVKGHPAGELLLVYLNGTYVSATNYTLRVMGLS